SRMLPSSLTCSRDASWVGECQVQRVPYWRERLLGLVNTFNLLPQQSVAIKELLRRLDRYDDVRYRR
ncbi:hypothetical protein, partial [Caballeronia sp. RCC_10]|uniref:hypothetical protein n=1 Tax=Caballeronia sp. RCC_10 TaxID=3239227 RepID=UPI0035265CE8